MENQNNLHSPGIRAVMNFRRIVHLAGDKPAVLRRF
jgi:hypothetical protein